MSYMTLTDLELYL